MIWTSATTILGNATQDSSQRDMNYHILVVTSVPKIVEEMNSFQSWFFFHSICYWFMPSTVYTNNIYIISMKAQPSETRFRHFDFMLSYRITRQYLIFINFYLIRRPLKGTIRHVSSFLQNNSIKWYSHWNEWFIGFKYFLQF